MRVLRVLYEDNHIIVVVKPPNLLTQGDATGDPNLLDLVKAYVKEKYNKPGDAYIGMVQRLDRPVGGIVIFARTSKAAARLTEALQKDHLSRKYLAVVHGQAREYDTFSHWLLKDEKTNMVKAFDREVPGSKQAILEYRLKEHRDAMSLIEVQLHTGRSHQIRVQLATMGLPIVGDMRYGKREKGTIGLWCYRLALMHPVQKEPMAWAVWPDYSPFDQFEGIQKNTWADEKRDVED